MVEQHFTDIAMPGKKQAPCHCLLFLYSEPLPWSFPVGCTEQGEFANYTRKNKVNLALEKLLFYYFVLNLHP
jgi:hypothetical protein